MAKNEKVVSFKIPSFNSELLKKINFNYLLTILLLINTLAVGALLIKVTHLQKLVVSGNLAAAPTAQAPAQGNQAPAPGAKVDVSAGKFPLLGKSDAKVTIIEFADFRCPFCEKFFTDTASQIIKDYVDTGKVKYAFRNYAFLGPASVVAANAAECANEQGQFWKMHEYFYKNQPSESDTSMYTVDNLTKIAGQLGIDTNKFNSCLSANKYDKNASADLADGQKAGVTGTPTVFINGISVVGAQPYSAFKTIIDQELAK
jgi:protein-disulfide isomerase